MAKAKKGVQGFDAQALNAMNRASDVSERLTSKVDKLADALVAMGKVSVDATKEVIESYEDLDDTIEDVDKEIKDLDKTMVKLNKTFGPKVPKKYNKAVDETKKKINELKKAKKGESAQEKIFRLQQIKQQAKVLKGIKAEVSGLKKNESGINKYANALKGTFQEIGTGRETIGALGVAAKGVGKMMGSAIGNMRFGPVIGAVATLGQAVWNVGMAADQFVKDANKSFASVRGPDIMTGDIKGQFKDFNDQIFNMAQNLRVGLNVNQIRELMGAISQAGMNITLLNKGLTSYRDAVYVASKASKTLGIDLPMAGAYMSKMMTDFRMDLDKVDKTFNMIAFDAKKSGLSVDRFWNVVQNANASLALYGVAISAASKTMKRFTDDNIGGADDAAQATEDMFSVFKTGSIGAQAALLDFAKDSGSNVSQMFADQAGELGEAIKNRKIDINLLEKKGKDRTSAESEQLEKLRKQQLTDMSQQKRFQAMVGQNSVVQTAEMGALAKSAPELLINAIKTIGQTGDISKISGERQIVVMQAMQKSLGVSEKASRMLIEEARVTKLSLEELVKETERMDTLTVGQGSQLLKISELKGDEQTRAMQSLQEELVANGWDSTSAQTLVQAASANAEIGKVALKRNKAEFIATLNSSRTSDKLLQKKFTDQQITQDQANAAAEGTFATIKDLTMSYNEAKDIALDEQKWRLNNISAFTFLNKTAYDILKWLIKDAPTGYETESQKMAKKQFIEAAKSDKLLQQYVAKGDISAGDQKSAIAAITKTMADAGGGGASIALSAIDMATTADNPLQSLDDSIKSLDKQITENADPSQNKALVYAREQLKTARKSEKVDKESLKDQVASLKTAQDTYDKANASLTTLNEMREVNKEISKYQKLVFMSSDSGQSYIADELARAMSSEDPTSAVKALRDSTGLSIEDLLKSGGSSLGAEQQTSLAGMAYGDWTPGSGWKSKKAYRRKLETLGIGYGDFDNLAQSKARMFTKSGVISVKAGEGIMGKEYAKTIPIESTATGSRGSAGGGVTNTFHISATETDLAQKIANVVRTEMNQFA